ncbi:MAG: hypothetical protein HUJ53_05555 [Holdemanella sp.]|nr:hypothetical protein [Holdemanella sp.]
MQADEEAKRPKCSCCDEPLWEFAYQIGDEIICDDCIKKFRIDTDKLVKG